MGRETTPAGGRPRGAGAAASWAAAISCGASFSANLRSRACRPTSSRRSRTSSARPSRRCGTSPTCCRRATIFHLAAVSPSMPSSARARAAAPARGIAPRFCPDGGRSQAVDPATGGRLRSRGGRCGQLPDRARGCRYGPGHSCKRISCRRGRCRRADARALEPARQRGEVLTGRNRHSRFGPRGHAWRRDLGERSRSGHSFGRGEGDLSEVRARPPRRRTRHCRHRPRTGHGLPHRRRPRRSRRCRQPGRARQHVHHRPARRAFRVGCRRRCPPARALDGRHS